MFVNKIEIKNFKSLKDISIEPSKITVLIGPNSGGKSSILHALSVIKQSLLDPNRGRGFSTSGSIIDLGSFFDVVWNHDNSKKIHFQVEGSNEPTDDFKKFFGEGLIHFTYGFSISNEQVESVNFSLKHKSLSIEPHTVTPSTREIPIQFRQGPGTANASWSANLLPGYSIKEHPSDARLEAEGFNKIIQNGKILVDFFKDFHYVPASRVMDEFSLPYVEVFHSDDIVTSGGNRDTLSRLLSYLSSNPNVADDISKWTLKLIGKTIITKNVRSYNTEQKGPNITIEFKRGNIERTIINEGTGPNQLILMLAILAIIKNNSIIGIEEPEIHLHPKGQSELAKILLEISIQKNQQLIFTTHSEHFLYPFLTSIASKKENSLKPNELSIYYFDADDKNVSSCEKLEIDAYGRIKGGLRGFFEENINSLNEYLEAVKSES